MKETVTSSIFPPIYRTALQQQQQFCVIQASVSNVVDSSPISQGATNTTDLYSTAGVFQLQWQKITDEIKCVHIGSIPSSVPVAMSVSQHTQYQDPGTSSPKRFFMFSVTPVP